MKATLHIGLEKTGTTSIQQFLVLNRAALQKAGQWVCASQHEGNNFHLALASFDGFRPDSLLKTLGINEAKSFDVFAARQARLLKAEVDAAGKAGCTHFVITSEHLQSRLLNAAEVGKLKQTLNAAGLDDIEVLVYLRSPLRIALSHHGMAIKKGVHVKPADLLPGNRRVRHILDFEKMLQLWSTAFGSTAMRVRLYPEGAGSDALLRQFCDELGLGIDFASLQLPPRTNTNLSEEALLILNAVNAESKLVAQQWKSREFFNALEVGAGGKGLRASADLIAAYEAEYRDALERIRAEYFAQNQGPLFVESAPADSNEANPARDAAIAAGAAVLKAALDLGSASAVESKPSVVDKAKRGAKRFIKRFL